MQLLWTSLSESVDSSLPVAVELYVQSTFLTTSSFTGTDLFIPGKQVFPLMTIVFGRLVDDFNGYGSGATTPEQLQSAVNRNAYVLLFNSTDFKHN